MCNSFFSTIIVGLSACFASSIDFASNGTANRGEDALLASPVLRKGMVFGKDISVGASHFPDSVKTVAKLSESTRTSDESSSSLDGYNFNTNVVDGEAVHNSPNFSHFFQEGYCKAAADECHESTEAVNDVDCSSPCGRQKPVDESDDDMLGCVFDFSEEGMNLKVLLGDFILVSALFPLDS